MTKSTFPVRPASEANVSAEELTEIKQHIPEDAVSTMLFVGDSGVLYQHDGVWYSIAWFTGASAFPSYESALADAEAWCREFL